MWYGEWWEKVKRKKIRIFIKFSRYFPIWKLIFAFFETLIRHYLARRNHLRGLNSLNGEASCYRTIQNQKGVRIAPHYPIKLNRLNWNPLSDKFTLNKYFSWGKMHLSESSSMRGVWRLTVMNILYPIQFKNSAAEAENKKMRKIVHT